MNAGVAVEQAGPGGEDWKAKSKIGVVSTVLGWISLFGVASGSGNNDGVIRRDSCSQRVDGTETGIKASTARKRLVLWYDGLCIVGENPFLWSSGVAVLSRGRLVLCSKGLSIIGKDPGDEDTKTGAEECFLPRNARAI